MNRKYAFLTAGFLTGLVLVALFSFNQSIGNSVRASALDAEASAPVQMAALPATTQQIADAEYARQVETALIARESALQNEVASGQATLATLDATYQPQLEALQTQLGATESAMGARMEQIAVLQTQVSEAEQAIQQDDLQYQQEINNMANANLYLRQQLETTLGELQAAYDQIAVQQASAAGDYGSGHHEDDDYDEDDEYEDDEYEEHEDDDDDDHDEYEEHDDDDDDDEDDD